MIKKSIIVFIGLFTSYWILASFVTLSASQHQNQDNIIKAQDYIYNNNGFDCVIVGSSLSSRINIDSLPNSYNISFGGLGVFDGLNIISNTKHKPNILLIETNFIVKNTDDDFTKSLFQPVNYYLRDFIPILRSKKQPLANIGKWIVEAIIKSRNKKLTQAEEHNTPKPNSIHSQEVFNTFMEIHKERYSKPYPTEQLYLTLSKLKAITQELEKEGVQIVFLEMPVNHSLTETPQPVSVRIAFEKHFPSAEYRYIKPPTYKFITSDGIHLNKYEVPIFSRYLISEINMLNIHYN